MTCKIYKLICNKSNLVYIGSTKQKLDYRLKDHIRCYNKWLENNDNPYYTSFEIIKSNDYKIELVEEIDSDDKEELHKKERYYIENNICVNKTIPTRTDKEYREENKDKIKQINIDYRKNNKEKCEEKRKEYYMLNYEKYKVYREKYNKENQKQDRKEYMKEYRNKNKEKIKEYNKNYRENKTSNEETIT
jgi:hypothetical protein